MSHLAKFSPFCSHLLLRAPKTGINRSAEDFESLQSGAVMGRGECIQHRDSGLRTIGYISMLCFKKPSSGLKSGLTPTIETLQAIQRFPRNATPGFPSLHRSKLQQHHINARQETGSLPRSRHRLLLDLSHLDAPALSHLCPDIIAAHLSPARMASAASDTACR